MCGRNGGSSVCRLLQCSNSEAGEATCWAVIQRLSALQCDNIAALRLGFRPAGACLGGHGPAYLELHAALPQESQLLLLLGECLLCEAPADALCQAAAAARDCFGAAATRSISAGMR